MSAWLSVRSRVGGVLEQAGRLRVAVVFAAVLVLVFALSASADRGVPAAERLFSIEPVLSAGADPKSWPLVDGKGEEQLAETLRKSVEREEDRKRELALPAARSEREDSRTAHVGVSDVVALELVEREFGKLLEGSPAEGGLDELAGGRRVARFVSDHVVVLEGEGEKPPVLLESPTALRTIDEDGRKRAVDLSLESGAKGFELENGAVEVVLPENLDEGVRVGSIGVVPAGSASGVLSGEGADRVVYPNAQIDTDVVVAPRRRGAEVFWQLRSPRSGEELTLDLDLPEGAVARRTEMGSVLVSKDAGAVATVSAPLAVDAQGRDVPVSMDVRGEQLVVSVEHRAADVAYPILVDPTFEDFGDEWNGWVFQTPESLSRLGDWSMSYGGGAGYGQYIQRHHCYVTVSCYPKALNANWNSSLPDGLHIYSQHTTVGYPAGSWAQFVYEPPGTTTQVEEAYLYAMYTRRGASPYPNMFTGIYSATAGWLSIEHQLTNLWDFIGHAPSSSAPGRRSAVFGMYTPVNVTNNNWNDGYIGGGFLALTDPEAPSISGGQLKRMSVPEDGSTGAWENRDNATRWVKPQDRLAIHPGVSDPGLGVRSVKITGTGVDNGMDSFCEGTKADPCPAVWPGAGNQTLITFDVSEMSEGPNTLTIHAWDALVRGTTRAFPIKVDATPPLISENDIAGSLWAEREQPGVAPENQPVLAPGTHSISFKATDLGASVTASGVERIEVRVDGQKESTASVVACPAGNCERSVSWSYDTTQFGGRHKIELYAEDGAGNEYRKVFYVNAPATGSLVYPADNEITSSKIALPAKDNDDDFTGVKFQYRRRPLDLSWTTISSNVTDDQGVVVSGDTHPLTEPGRHSQKLIWDVRTAMGALVPKADHIQVRAVFTGGGAEFRSQVANVEIDHKGLSADNAQEGIGPGSVDLLTGNFSFTATDAALSTFSGPIEVKRTFNSLDPDANGPFGPGWVVSAPVGGVSDYSSLVVLTEPMMTGWVDLFDSAGKRIRFEKTGDTTFKVQTGFEGLTLERIPGSSDKYLLTDLDGVETTFVILATTSKFVPSKVKQPDEQGTASYNYEAYLGEPRLTRVVAPPPPNTDCDRPNLAATLLPLGCRVLEFVYMYFPSFGEERLRTIQQVASDGTAMVPNDIAGFRYRAWGEHIGRLVHAYDPRIAPELTEVYEYAGASHRLGTITPPGQAPWSLGYVGSGTHIDKLSSVSRTADASGLESWRMAWGVPLSTTTGGPYDMTTNALAVWGQQDRPIDATAILPPTETGSGYSKATINYLNQDGRVVNSATPGGRISVAEYDPKGNVVRELTAANRARAALYPGNTEAKADYSRTIDIQRTYSASGLRLTDELGPEHEVKLDSGQIVNARAHTHTSYDEGYVPIGNDPAQLHLPTTTATGAQVDDSDPDEDVRAVKTAYNWTLRKPTKTIVDAVSGGLNIESETHYNDAGLETSSWQPKSNGSDAGATETVYYGDSGDEDCDDHIEWFNLPCKTKPAAQPGTAGLPDLPVTTYTYDPYGNVLTATEQVGEVSRTTTTTYDPAGRKLTESVTTDEPEEEEEGGVPEGLVAAYGFDEGSGSTVADSSGTGNGGTVSGASWSSSGKFGNALSFDGVNDKVSIPDSNSLDLSDGMTLSAWVRPDTMSSYRTVVLKEGSSDLAYSLYAGTTSDDAPGVEIRGHQLTGWDVIPDSSWTHLAATYDGSTLRLYVDGVQIASEAETAAIPATSNPLSIGGNNMWGQYFDGLIDEVRIYNHALTAQEIQADKGISIADQVQGQGGGGGGAPEGMVASYGFEEGSGSTAADSSGAGNGGTVSGASWTTAGKFGNALDFDGVNDKVSVPDSSSLDLSGGMTLSAWLKPDTVGGWRTALLKEGSSDLAYALYAGTSDADKPGVEIRGNLRGGTAALSTGAWTHLAGTYDGSTLRLYVNGAQVASEAETATIPATSNPLSIGGNGMWGEWFDGLIDEVRIYDRALTQQEIQADKDTSIADQVAPEPDPSPASEPIPTVTYGYSTTTGRPTTVSADGKTTTTAYDNVGRVINYTDADGTTSTTFYDNLNRPFFVSDDKGSQTFSYHADTGLLTSLEDSHAGTFTASYDADGRIVSKTYPNGMKADTTYDPSGSPVALKYTKTSNCSSNCVWIDEQVTESIHGQWRTHSWELSSQEYDYDKAGRLTEVVDDVESPGAVAGCSIRSYAFDLNSNRTSLNTKAPAGNGDCQPGVAGTTKSYSYDDADRLTGTGIQYDPFGRMTSIPAQHSGGGVLSYTYYANDQVRTISQDGVSKTYALDPTGRQRQSVATDGTTHTETLHYQDGSDSPSWTRVTNGQGQEVSWERNVEGIDGDLAAIRTHTSQGDTTVLQLQNLHGDIIATASTSTTATALTARFETDEFGNPRQQTGRRYGWLGGKQRRAELASGVIQMGVRSYIPALGRFSTVDPIAGGSANDYDYADQDPVNKFDLTGQCVGPVAFLAPVCLRVAATLVVAGFRIVAKTGRVGRGVRKVTWAGGSAKVNFKELAYTPHTMGRMVQRGISRRSVRKALVKGDIYWDPKYSRYSFFRMGGKGKYTHVAVDPVLGVIRTAVKTRKIPKRMRRESFQ